MKLVKKGLIKKILLILVALIVVSVTSFSIFFIKTTSGVKLDQSKLVLAEETLGVKLFDKDGKELDSNFMFSDNLMVKVDELPEYVKQAFVVTEDKRFYKHSGVDYKRMVGALVNNIKNGKASQGASTISQQLIKNTHLSREKTIERKLKEIKLAYALENKYSKDEILELYLNNIYFGNGCYGLEKASRYYFDKPSSELEIGEAAILVGVINAPSYYDPISKNENSEKRKRLVLKLMKNEGVITEEEYNKNAKRQENIVKNASKTANQHLKCVLSEICDKLNVSENQIKNMGINVYTSLDSELQDYAFSVVNDQRFLPKNVNGVSPTSAVIIVDNETKSVVAIAGNMRHNVLDLKRQPGSTIKPILVYAPALEQGKIYPESIIVDEKININGYSPTNANKSYSGAVSIRTAVEKSLNVPAVKVLSKVGVNKAKSFATNLGIEFSDDDQNLALALGGMTKGVTVKQLADAYSAFASLGEFAQSDFITKITDTNGDVLYERKLQTKNVMDKETAFLMTDMLKSVVKNGTARRLNAFDFDIASKTGTVGLTNSSSNTDAFNVTYTSSHTIVSWVGALSQEAQMGSYVNGSSYPTEMTKSVLNKLYGVNPPTPFKVPEGIVKADIDTRSLLSSDVELASEEVSEKYKKEALFSSKYLPPISKNIEAHVTKLEVTMEEGNKPTLSFITKTENEYILYRDNMKTHERVTLTKVKGDGEIKSYLDSSALSGEIYEYFVISNTLINENKTRISNSIKLMSY